MKIAQTVRINSMIDISDGLSTDLNRICKASGVGAVIDAQRIPISRAAQKDAEPLESALNDGEDFELLFTLCEQDCRQLSGKWDEPMPITQIGCVTNSGKMQIKTRDGRLENLGAGGYEHLKN